MNTVPQEIIDDINGDGAPATVSGPQNAIVPETRSDGDEKGNRVPQILSPDQQAVMHRVSEAIAMIVYDEKANKPIIDMAMQGPEGIVKAVSMVLAEVASKAKPGIPRELLPMAAIACLMLINDFIEKVGQKPAEMREVLPMMIDVLGKQFNVNPMENAQLRRIKAKFERADKRSIMQRNLQDEPAAEAEGPAAEEAEPAEEGEE